jgi:hypothetical protein
MVRVFQTLSRRRGVAVALGGLVLVLGSATGAGFLASSGAATKRAPSVHAASLLPRTTIPTAPPTTTTTTTTTTVVPNAAPSGSPRVQSGTPAAAPQAPATEIIVCESPNTVDSNGVQTGGETAYRAPAGTPPPVGCHLG